MTRAQEQFILTWLLKALQFIHLPSTQKKELEKDILELLQQYPIE